MHVYTVCRKKQLQSGDKTVQTSSDISFETSSTTQQLRSVVTELKWLMTQSTAEVIYFSLYDNITRMLLHFDIPWENSWFQGLSANAILMRYRHTALKHKDTFFLDNIALSLVSKFLIDYP